jgi:hypothetical protein
VATAFQPNTFQSDAFQIHGGVTGGAITVNIGGTQEGDSGLLVIQNAQRTGAPGGRRKSKKYRERYIAKYKDQLFEFATLADLEAFVDEKKEEQADKPKKQRATIKIKLAKEFASEIEDEISVPPRLQYMPLGAAMAQIRRIDHSIEVLLAKRRQEIDDDDEEAMLWLLI